VARGLIPGARPESARADSGRAKIPKAGRFAAGAAAIVASLLAVLGAGGAGTQTPRVGGTLVFGTQGAQGNLREPPCLNALLDRCITTGTLTLFVAQKVLEGAYEARPDHTWRPKLVSHVSFTRKPPFTLVYHIRPAARWSDGVPVSARDFVFTFRASLELKDELSAHDLVEYVRRVRAVGAKTVRVDLRSRFAGWRGLFAMVLPSHALAGEDLRRIWTDGIHNPKTGGPIGSGPFVVQRWERGTQITLVRNPRYWGPRRPYLDRLVVRYRMSSLEPIDWLRSGEVDIAQHFRLAGVPALRREPGVRIVPGPTASYEHFTFRLGRGGHPALRSKLVRRALAHGMDRAALIRGSPFGDADPTLRPQESVVYFTQSPYYRAKWSTYRHSPQVARRLLEEAGCRRGADGIYACAGERLSLRFVTLAGLPARARVLSLVQEQLRESGVEVLPIFTTFGALFGQLIPSGDFDVAYFGWFRVDPSASGADTVYGCGGFQNYSGYCQRLVTRDLDQANRILDAAEQARALNRADAQLARDVPVIPLLQVPFPAAVRATVRNVVLSPFNPLWGAENWWLAEPR
jgi:peptide/nickel transport system substrate-binding protein